MVYFFIQTYPDLFFLSFLAKKPIGVGDGGSGENKQRGWGWGRGGQATGTKKGGGDGFPTFPTSLVWSAQGISENISHLGVKRYKITHLIEAPLASYQAPLYRNLWGYGAEGLGYSPRIINMILEVNSLPNILDSIMIRIVNELCPLKILWPLRRGGWEVGVTNNWPSY